MRVRGAAYLGRDMLSPAILDKESRRAFRAVKAVLGLDRWPEIPIRWNRRLRRAGRAIIEMPAAGFQSAAIELSPAYFAVYPGDLYGILVHEAHDDPNGGGFSGTVGTHKSKYRSGG